MCSHVYAIKYTVPVGLREKFVFMHFTRYFDAQQIILQCESHSILHFSQSQTRNL